LISGHCARIHDHGAAAEETTDDVTVLVSKKTI